MRKANDLSQAQLILNQLNNQQNVQNSKPLDRKGLQIKNLGAATAPSDAVTLGQLADLVQSQIQSSVPRAVQTADHYTMIWSNQGAPQVGDLLQPYCVVSANRVGIPLYCWLACNGITNLNGPISIQMQLNGLNILKNTLVLSQGSKGPVQTSAFVGNPKFGVGAALVPVIVAAGGQAAVSIGLVVQVTGTLSLAPTNKA